jgi:hypothetical protein
MDCRLIVDMAEIAGDPKTLAEGAVAFESDGIRPSVSSHRWLAARIGGFNNTV